MDPKASQKPWWGHASEQSFASHPESCLWSSSALPGRRQPVCCLCSPGPSGKVRQMVTASGKSTRLPSSSIYRAAAGLASSFNMCVPSSGGAQDRDSAQDLAAVRPASPQHLWQVWASAKGSYPWSGYPWGSYYHGDFLSSPDEVSRETYQCGEGGRQGQGLVAKYPRDWQPREPLHPRPCTQALSRQRRLSCAPTFASSWCFLSPAANDSTWR